MVDFSTLLMASEAVAHAKPKALGLDATMWVSLAMLALIGIFIWKKVPALVTKSLDDKIAAIKTQLDEAARIRAEAEAMRGEYETRLKSIEADAIAVHAQAEADAKAILVQAKSDSIDLIKRRETMAEQRIMAAETAAIAEVRTTAANLAAQTAAAYLSAKHDAKTDAKLVDVAISELN